MLMKCIINPYTYFWNHMWDESLCLLSSAEYWSSNIWYKRLVLHMRQFEILSFEYMFIMDYINELNAKWKQIFAWKTICRKPSATTRYIIFTPLNWFIQPSVTLVIIAPRAIHSGVNYGYNIASRPNFSDSYWLRCSRLIPVGTMTNQLFSDGSTPSKVLFVEIFQIKHQVPQRWARKNDEDLIFRAYVKSASRVRRTSDLIMNMVNGF